MWSDGPIPPEIRALANPAMLGLPFVHAANFELSPELLDEAKGLIDALRSGEFESAQSIVEGARDQVLGERGRIGGRLKGLDAERNAALETFENVSGALSLIEDTDVAQEVSSLVRAQILEEASVKTIQIEREQAAGALKLLEGAMAIARG